MIFRGILIACVVLLLSSCNASLPPPRAYPLAHHKTLYISAGYANSGETFMFTSISASVPVGTPATLVVSSKDFTYQCSGVFGAYGDKGQIPEFSQGSIAGPPGQYTLTVNIPGYGTGAYVANVQRHNPNPIYYLAKGCVGIYPPGLHYGYNSAVPQDCLPTRPCAYPSLPASPSNPLP